MQITDKTYFCNIRYVVLIYVQYILIRNIYILFCYYIYIYIILYILFILFIFVSFINCFHWKINIQASWNIYMFLPSGITCIVYINDVNVLCIYVLYIIDV